MTHHPKLEEIRRRSFCNYRTRCTLESLDLCGPENAGSAIGGPY